MSELKEHPAFRTKHPSEGVFEKILIILAVFTMIEVIISLLLENGTLPLIVAGILLVFFAFSKATFVGGYFMHIFYEKKPFTIFMIGFGFPMMIVTPIALVALTI